MFGWVGVLNKSIKTRALIWLVAGPLVLATILYKATGGFKYWQAWVLLFIFCSSTTFTTVDLIINDPALLARRMRAGPSAEKRPAQRLIMLVLTVLFVAVPVVAGLDFKHGWSHVPPFGALLGDAVVIVGYALMHIVMKTNTFASSTIELTEGQNVISTGPYSVVRHPMYLGGLLFFTGIPIAMGSLWALIPAIPTIPLLICRIHDEEKMLKQQLQGYEEYCSKVRYRLIPFIY